MVAGFAAWLRSQHGVEACIISSLAVTSWLVEIQFDVIGKVSNRLQSTGFDSEYFVEAIFFISLGLVIWTIRRSIELRREVTKRKSAELEAYVAARHDLLTGLANRRFLMERIDALIRQSGSDENSLAVLLIDLDRFKPVNDIYGHATGDRVLTEVGKRLSHLTSTGECIARLGGDEFVVLLRA
jgi:PleD family two-component response regulator